MFELLVFGTFWFWVITAVFVITVTSFVEVGFPGRATVATVIFFLLLYFLGGFPFVQWIVANPGPMLLLALLYFIAGGVYCVIKWYFFLLNIRDRYIEYGSDPKHKITVSSHSDRLIGWIIYWPFSAFWTLINDPVKRIATAIYRQIEVLLQRMADRIVNNFPKEQK